MEKIGDAYPFVLPGLWGSWAVLVTRVGAGVALLVEFPLFLRFWVEPYLRKPGRNFSPIHLNIILYNMK
jgi:hypothetical protein